MLISLTKSITFFSKFFTKILRTNSYRLIGTQFSEKELNRLNTPFFLTIKSNRKEFQITKGLWKNYNLWDLYEKGSTPLSWQKELFNYAESMGLICFSSVFDDTSINFLNKINNPIYIVFK